jgi:hypothetical protein
MATKVAMAPLACWRVLVFLVYHRHEKPCARELLARLRGAAPETVNACKALLLSSFEGGLMLTFNGIVGDRMIEVVHSLADAAGVDPLTGELPPEPIGVQRFPFAAGVDPEIGPQPELALASAIASASDALANVISALKRISVRSVGALAGELPPTVPPSDDAASECEEAADSKMDPKIGWRELLMVTYSSEGKLPDGIVQDLMALGSGHIHAAREILTACSTPVIDSSERNDFDYDALAVAVRKLAEAAEVDPVTGQWPGSEDTAGADLPEVER